MIKWHIYRGFYLIGIAKSKHDAIKRLEILQGRLLNKPEDTFGKDYISTGVFMAKREETHK
jgi:hypothetical protein